MTEKTHKEKLAEARLKWADQPRKANAEPVGRNEIRTADPVTRELFLIAYRRKIFNKELAKKIGCSTVALSRWRKGQTTPSMLDVVSLATALGYAIKIEKKSSD